MILDGNLKAIMTDKFGQLLFANAELAAANIALMQSLQAKDKEIDALKTELASARNLTSESAPK